MKLYELKKPNPPLEPKSKKWYLENYGPTRYIRQSLDLNDELDKKLFVYLLKATNVKLESVDIDAAKIAYTSYTVLLTEKERDEESKKTADRKWSAYVKAMDQYEKDLKQYYQTIKELD